MDIITTPPYEEMQAIYSKYFSLGFLGSDINEKFALISLICYITEKMKKQKKWIISYIAQLGADCHGKKNMKQWYCIIDQN